MSWVSLSVYQTCNSFGLGGLGDPFVRQGSTYPNSDSWQYHGVLRRCEGWHIILLLWLGMSIGWWNLLYLLANYRVGFWVLKSDVSRAGNLRWFLRAIFKNIFLCSGARHEATFSSFLMIQRDWAGCRQVSCDGITPSERQLSFKTISANNAVTSHLLLCFLSLLSGLGIAFGIGKAHPLNPGKKQSIKKQHLFSCSS